MARPLPRHLKDGQVVILFRQIRDVRDRAIFMLMLRCGLRVEEVVNLTMDAGSCCHLPSSDSFVLTSALAYVQVLFRLPSL